MSIPIIDVDVQPEEGFWSQALADDQQLRGAAQLVKAMRREAERDAVAIASHYLGEAVGGVVGPAALAALKKAVQALNRLLGSNYRRENDQLAQILGVTPDEVLLANVAYDLAANAGAACSTFVTSTSEGPLHARNLDWGFPRQLLRRHTTVFRFHGAPCGDYATVTWPGLFGVLTGIAPGRFSVTVNYVKHATESGFGPSVKRAVKGHWPVAWAVRQALDDRGTFDDAVEYLSMVPLLAPVLFTVAGASANEGVVIERTPDDHFVWEMDSRSPVYVTNHYTSDEFAACNIGINEIDTEQRYDALVNGLGGKVDDAASALRLLSRKSLMSEITAHQVVMRPADGTLVVRVPGQKPVTVDLG